MFFEAERQNFFRPLNGKRRELVAACLRSLYERLHGPGADYSQNLNRDSLRDVLMPAIREHAAEVIGDGLAEDDDLASIDSNDVQLLAGALIRSLLKDGWLESFGDRVGLVTAYRLTRAGKLFAEALWSLSRLRTRSRQRNVRGCPRSTIVVPICLFSIFLYNCNHPNDWERCANRRMARLALTGEC